MADEKKIKFAFVQKPLYQKKFKQDLKILQEDRVVFSESNIKFVNIKASADLKTGVFLTEDFEKTTKISSALVAKNVEAILSGAQSEILDIANKYRVFKENKSPNQSDVEEIEKAIKEYKNKREFYRNCAKVMRYLKNIYAGDHQSSEDVLFLNELQKWSQEYNEKYEQYRFKLSQDLLMIAASKAEIDKIGYKFLNEDDIVKYKKLEAEGEAWFIGVREEKMARLADLADHKNVKSAEKQPEKLPEKKEISLEDTTEESEKSIEKQPEKPAKKAEFKRSLVVREGNMFSPRNSTSSSEENKESVQKEKSTPLPPSPRQSNT